MSGAIKCWNHRSVSCMYNLDGFFPFDFKSLIYYFLHERGFNDKIRWLRFVINFRCIFNRFMFINKSLWSHFSHSRIPNSSDDSIQVLTNKTLHNPISVHKDDALEDSLWVVVIRKPKHWHAATENLRAPIKWTLSAHPTRQWHFHLRYKNNFCKLKQSLSWAPSRPHEKNILQTHLKSAMKNLLIFVVRSV